jgi:uncharacterized membrane protein YphA (DoxX/SURF4 family)
MLEQLFQPLPFAQVMATLMLAILFLQSGLDKVLDFGGNLGWLSGHFAKTPLRGAVLPMLITITVTEVLAGALCGVGVLQLLQQRAEPGAALWGARLATLNVVMLFLGQRMAKDYAGAASLVPYFVLCVGTLLLLAA